MGKLLEIVCMVTVLVCVTVSMANAQGEVTAHNVVMLKFTENKGIIITLKQHFYARDLFMQMM